MIELANRWNERLRATATFGVGFVDNADIHETMRTSASLSWPLSD